MSIIELVKQYGGGKGDAAMWRSVEAMSEYVDRTKSGSPGEYERMMRKVYEAMNGKHYDDYFASKAVDGIRYTDVSGAEHSGAHWTKDQVSTAWNARTFADDVTDCDKWVAANAMYADLCKAFSDDQILEAAYLFYFADEDWDGEGKIWEYMHA